MILSPKKAAFKNILDVLENGSRFIGVMEQQFNLMKPHFKFSPPWSGIH
jgi:hypothetical protein